MTRQKKQAAIPKASRYALLLAPNLLIHAVMRICSPRFKAMTEPIIASHKNKMEANSSDQTNGAFSKYRPTTPENKIPIQASTREAASHSTTLATTASTPEITPTKLTQACPCISQAKTMLRPRISLSIPNKNQPVLIFHGIGLRSWS